MFAPYLVVFTIPYIANGMLEEDLVIDKAGSHAVHTATVTTDVLNIQNEVAEVGSQGSCSKLKSVDGGAMYTVEVEVGRPEQRLDVVVDTGSNLLVVESCVCRDSGYCNPAGKCFREQHSDTLSLVQGSGGFPATAILNFGSGSILTEIATDRVRIGQLSTRMKKGVLLMVDQLLDFFGAFEGLLGLGLPNSVDGPLALRIGSREGPFAASGAADAEQPRTVQMDSADAGPAGPPPWAGAAANGSDRVLDVAAAAGAESVAGEGFLAQAGVSRFSVCLGDDTDQNPGILRFDPPAMSRGLKSVGTMHWGLDFRGVSVGDSAATLGFCSGSLMLAKSHFQMREYGRAAHALQHVKDLHRSPAALFLKLYSLYLAGEKRREEEAMEVADPVEKCQVKNAELKTIEEQLAALHKKHLLDGLNMYLYGMALRGLEQKSEARQVLLQAVHAFPCNWSAWLDIIAISSDLNDVTSIHSELKLPVHWMVRFFEAALYMELQRNEDARKLYAVLRRHFPDSSYILSQVATCCYNVRNFDASQQSFDEMRKRDPYKLASLDTYSNILYVKEQSAALSHLARQAIKIDKYTPEACCIIGNYYSLKGEHEKSVTYFQRALCLNRNFTPAWILMGHEFMEMKNTPAAIDAYRTAVNINQRDYRAWYGLGQTYELLNLHFYALFYYRRAMMLRPDDARMWCAMAQCYDSMERRPEALRCYERAHRCGDRERMALPRLARLHRDLGHRRQAAAYYGQLLAEAEAAAAGALPAEAVEALRFLMQLHREEGRPAECAACAERLLDTAGPERDEAKAALRDLRAAAGGAGVFEVRDAATSQIYDPAAHWTVDHANM